MKSRNGDHLTVTDAYGRTTEGTLHLPSLRMSGPTVPAHDVPQVLTEGYQVVTPTLPNGNRFRTEGRLS